MAKRIKLFISIFLFFTLGVEAAIAGTAKGNADVYKVTMRKIELCTGYTVVDFDNVNTDNILEDDLTIVGLGK